MHIPITVSGESSAGPFDEQTQTLVINAHGALITLAARVSQGQKLDLKSITSPNKQACHVVYVGPTLEGKTQFGIEFTAPAPRFWKVAFPPEDWTPAMLDDPKAPGVRKGVKTPA